MRGEASEQHYFDTFEHPCRGIGGLPLINVEKWILTFFSRDVALYHFISGVTDLISSKRSDY